LNLDCLSRWASAFSHKQGYPEYASKYYEVFRSLWQEGITPSKENYSHYYESKGPNKAAKIDDSVLLPGNSSKGEYALTQKEIETKVVY
jgi:hypothetical protein